MAKQTFTTGQVLLASQLTDLQQTALFGGAASAKTASYTLVAADAGTSISMTSTSATTITVNTGLFSNGDTVLIQNLGSGNCTITAGSATVNTAGSLILPQYDAGILKFVSASSAVFYDFIQVGATSPLTTKGDLYGFSTSDQRIPIGANATVLTADSTEALGLKWATPAGGGKVLQVVQGTLTSDASTSNGSLTNTGLSVSITPSLATSKVLVFVSFKGGTLHTGTQSSLLSVYALIRTSTQLQAITYGIDNYSASNGAFYQGVLFSYLDSPATTSATTYKVQFFAASANTTVHLFASATEIANIVAMEIGA